MRCAKCVNLDTVILVDSDLLANWFLDQAEAQSIPLTGYGLNAMLYIANCWALNLCAGPLCKEMFVARPNGPALPTVEIFAKDITPGWRMGQVIDGKLSVRRLALASENAELLTLLDRIWQQYQRWSDDEFTRALTAPNTPWDIAWNKRGGNTRIGMPIAERAMRDAFYAISILQPPLSTEPKIS
jgi:uncharacterized phage-associated protein